MSERKTEQNAAIDVIDVKIKTLRGQINLLTDAWYVETVIQQKFRLSGEIALVEVKVQELETQRALIVKEIEEIERLVKEQQEKEQQEKERLENEHLEHQQLLRDANEKNEQLRQRGQELLQLQAQLQLKQQERQQRELQEQELEHLDLPPQRGQIQLQLQRGQERKQLPPLLRPLREIHGLVREFRKELKGTLDELEHAIALLDEMGYEIDQGLEKIEKGSQSESEGESEEY